MRVYELGRAFDNKESPTYTVVPEFSSVNMFASGYSNNSQ